MGGDQSHRPGQDHLKGWGQRRRQHEARTLCLQTGQRRQSLESDWTDPLVRQEENSKFKGGRSFGKEAAVSRLKATENRK